MLLYLEYNNALFQQQFWQNGLQQPVLWLDMLCQAKISFLFSYCYEYARPCYNHSNHHQNIKVVRCGNICWQERKKKSKTSTPDLRFIKEQKQEDKNLAHELVAWFPTLQWFFWLLHVLYGLSFRTENMLSIGKMTTSSLNPCWETKERDTMPDHHTLKFYDF